MTASLAHLSDPHITTGVLGGAPAQALRHALARTLMLDPRPDAVVITGDLTDHGRPEEYAALREVLGHFPLPLHLVAGNHDDPAALRAAFAGTPFLGGGPGHDPGPATTRARTQARTPGYLAEPTSFLPHLPPDDSTTWVTHMVAVSHAAAPVL